MYSPSNVERLVGEFGSLLSILSDEFGFDINDPNLKDTPRRVIKTYSEFLAGYKVGDDEIQKLFSVGFPAAGYDQMVIVKDIEFSSLCAHHMLPFYGYVNVGYIPSMRVVDGNASVIGLSKIPRLVEVFSKRLQIQEGLTQQIADCLDTYLNPVGCGVVIKNVTHLCMKIRGVKNQCGTMTTSALYGDFRDDPDVRREFLDLIK